MKYDVAVIGAGPAGAWTAYLLARRGVRVALFDPSHPREKPCGGGVTGRALALVADAIGEHLPAVAIRAARFVEAATGASTSVPLDAAPNGGLAVTSRTRFDGLLLSVARRAGAQFAPARLASIARDHAGWRIEASDSRIWRAAFLVGADGANSFVRRQLAQAFRRDQLSIATGFFVHGTTNDEIVIEFTTDPPGYIWSFPRPDHLAIGVCAQADRPVTAATLRARTARWIETMGVASGARLEPYAWPIPSLSARDFETLDVAGPGWMLVGDAAGLVDPITREGIFFALQSASFAADALSSNRSPIGKATHLYRNRVAAEIARDLARAARLKAGFFRPHFIELMLDLLRNSERIRRVMADVVAGTQSYGGLKWRLARTFELRLALKALSASL